jgi:hypothetical protein
VPLVPIDLLDVVARAVEQRIGVLVGVEFWSAIDALDVRFALFEGVRNPLV